MATRYASSGSIRPARPGAASIDADGPASRIGIARATAMLLAINLALLLSACLLFQMARSAHWTADKARIGRYERMEIAHELGRNASQMSRVARAYAVTGDRRFLGFHRDILAIQQGRVARPQPYHRTYWDLVIAGAPQNASGRTVALSTLARETEFSGGEQALFAQAVRRVEALARAEDTALIGAGRGDRRAAEALLFSDAHSQAKAEAMKPLDALYGRIEGRSRNDAGRAQAQANMMIAILYAVLCVSAAAAAISAWRLVTRVVRPMIRLSAIMVREAANPGAEAIPYADRDDEIGRMARALAGLRSAAGERDGMRDAEHRLAKRREDEAAAHARALAEAGTRTRRAQATEALVRRLGGDLLHAMDAVRDASGALGECADTMTLVAQSNACRVAEVEEGGRDTAERVDAVAATCRQLARTTSEIEVQTDRSICAADRVVEAVHRTSATVDALMAHGTSIQGIVTLIGSIAAKTNRLAINATIEAAQAGEAGRGFAVVAGEVKSLAKQTASAANDISQQLQAVRTRSRETAEMVGAIAANIADSREISRAIGDAVERQASATAQISANADRAADRTRDCAASMATMRVKASTTHEAIARMIGAASALTGTSDAVNEIVDRFAAEVQAT